MSHYTLSEDEAFLAMSRFLWAFANRSGNDLFGLLGDLHMEADGRPTDPAAWDEWIASVRAVKDEAGLPSDDRRRA